MKLPWKKESWMQEVKLLLLYNSHVLAGTKHLQALNNLLLWQKVAYDFEYHPLEFQTDIPAVVLSQSKSLFTVTFHFTNKSLQLILFVQCSVQVVLKPN